MDYEAWIKELAEREGASVEQSDVERLKTTNEDDRGRLMSALESQYDLRGQTGRSGSGPDSSERTKQGYGSGRNETAEEAPQRGQSHDVASSWLNQQPTNAGGVSGAVNTGAMFPAWYQDAIQRQQQEQQRKDAENTQRADALYSQLSQKANQSLQIDRNDPIIRAQADAYSANQERSKRNYLSDVAERSGPLANIRGEQRMAAERVGQATGSFEAELLGRELTARRDEIMQALQMSGSLLNADQQRQLQSELAMLDQAIKEQNVALGFRGQDLDYSLGREGLGVQRRGQDFGMDQFLKELAIREWDTTNKWDYAWAGL